MKIKTREEKDVKARRRRERGWNDLNVTRLKNLLNKLSLQGHPLFSSLYYHIYKIFVFTTASVCVDFSGSKVKNDSIFFFSWTHHLCWLGLNFFYLPQSPLNFLLSIQQLAFEQAGFRCWFFRFFFSWRT